MSKTAPFCLLLCCILFADQPLAQQEQPDTSPTNPPPTQPAPQQQPQRLPEMKRPLYLSGKIIYQDGSPASTGVQVELLCNGRVRRQVHAFNGGFSFILNEDNPRITVMDAGISSLDAMGEIGASQPGETAQLRRLTQGDGENLADLNPNQVNLLGCELRGSQPGFQSDVIPLGFRRPLDDPDVGTIVLFKAGSISGTTTSVTTMAAPKKARKAYKTATKELQRKDPDHSKAEASLREAIDVYPEFSEAWDLLGQLLLRQGNEAEARTAFETAVSSDPVFVQPYVAMMELEFKSKNWSQVCEWSAKLADLNPYYLAAHYYRGIANMQLNNLDEAETSLTKVATSYKADEFPYSGYMLGYLLASKGNFPDAAEHLRKFLKAKPAAPEADTVRAQIAQWENQGVLAQDNKN